MYLGKYLGSCKNLQHRYNFTMPCCDECLKDLQDGIAPVGYYETTEGYYALCCKHYNAIKSLKSNELKDENEQKVIHWKFT